MNILSKFAIAASLAAVCAVGAIAEQTRTVVLKVERMVCSGCVESVQRALRKVPGVQQAAVDLDKKTATVKFDVSRTNTEALTHATAAVGFPSAVLPWRPSAFCPSDSRLQHRRLMGQCVPIGMPTPSLTASRCVAQSLTVLAHVSGAQFATASTAERLCGKNESTSFLQSNCAPA